MIGLVSLFVLCKRQTRVCFSESFALDTIDSEVEEIIGDWKRTFVRIIMWSYQTGKGRATVWISTCTVLWKAKCQSALYIWRKTERLVKERLLWDRKAKRKSKHFVFRNNRSEHFYWTLSSPVILWEQISKISILQAGNSCPSQQPGSLLLKPSLNLYTFICQVRLFLPFLSFLSTFFHSYLKWTANNRDNQLIFWNRELFHWWYCVYNGKIKPIG